MLAFSPITAQGPMRHILAQPHVHADHRLGMHAIRWQRGGKQLGRAGKPEARLLRLNNALALQIALHESGAQNHHTGLAGESLSRRRRILRKDQIRWTGHCAGVDALDRMLRASLRQLAAQCFNQFAQRHLSSLNKSAALPPVWSSSGGESRATGQGNGESTPRSR
jgi:hypothetical protein